MDFDEITKTLQEMEIRQMALLSAAAVLAKHLPAAHADLQLLVRETPQAPVSLPDQTLQVFADTIRAVLRDPDVNPWRDK